MRIAVTGAGGFVGRALCRALATGGHTVIACIRSDEGPEGADEVRRITDITERDSLCEAFAGVDAVVHLAGRAHVMADGAIDPLAEYRHVNVEGTRAVAEAAADAGVRRVVFVSSVKVNGEGAEGAPYRETDQPAPEDAYGITKHEAERALFDIAQKRGFEAVCLRPPLVYGPGVRANFAALMKLCDSGLPLPFGAITQNRRSLIYVDNLTSAIMAALLHEKAAGQIFLVRDNDDFSTAGLIRALRQALGRPARLIPIPSCFLNLLLRLAGRGAMAKRLLGSLTVDDGTIRAALGWSPPVTTTDAMIATARGAHDPRQGDR